MCLYFSGDVAWKRLRNISISDPLGIFATFFTAYNGLLLFSFALAANPHVREELYPIEYSDAVYLKCACLSTLAAVGIWSAHRLSRWIAGTPKQCTKARVKHNSLASFAVGLVFFLIGLTLYFIDYGRGGGYIALLSVTRVERGIKLSDIRGGLPYLSFVYVGVAFLAYSFSEAQRKVHKVVLFSCVCIWLLLTLAMGDRRPGVATLLIVFGVVTAMRRSKLKLTIPRVAAIILLYVVVVGFGSMRFVVFARASGLMTSSEASNWILDNASLDWISPAKSEFAGPYITLADAVDRGRGFSLGESYLAGIPQVLPRSVYPGEKPEAINDEFASEMAARGGLQVVSGWGYSPVAEAYLNFRSAGVLPVFFFGAIFCACVFSSRLVHPASNLVSALMLPVMLDANRTDWSNLLQGTVFTLVVFCIALLFVNSGFEPSRQHLPTGLHPSE